MTLGLAIGAAVPRDSGSFRSSGVQLAAAGPLDRALDRQLAGEGERGGIRLGLSFADREGRYCRSFTAQAQSGLACRSGEEWRIEGLVRAAPDESDYRMAAGQDPALAAIIDSRLAGEPFDAQGEARLIERGWSTR
jgi:hypothetical protein